MFNYHPPGAMQDQELGTAVVKSYLLFEIGLEKKFNLKIQRRMLSVYPSVRIKLKISVTTQTIWLFFLWNI